MMRPEFRSCWRNTFFFPLALPAQLLIGGSGEREPSERERHAQFMTALLGQGAPMRELSLGLWGTTLVYSFVSDRRSIARAEAHAVQRHPLV